MQRFYPCSSVSSLGLALTWEHSSPPLNAPGDMFVVTPGTIMRAVELSLKPFPVALDTRPWLEHNHYPTATRTLT